ncbi:uncharacterized protein B0T23DRAFT_455348 [Neurospora hispaniola]|uniref:RING-type domain-containing protein n=1 Tax=Neurospora hispaniola TaxID=588809 RepID=A0AAJ0MPP8_9PEZI|nr:hypothetical protein B0T23DRAFT_455348 [Neurospora hispaniola]
MPSVFDSPPKKAKTIKSAFDSESFDADLTIHVDGLVGSATISPSGRDVALASPEGLAIIDLDSPWNPPRRLSSHGLPWLVVDVQWSPFAARDYWVASTANHRCLVWNLNMRDDSPSGAIEHSLQAHSRAITDINFSAHHPDLLASCSVDGYVHHWDLRRPRQPALSFCDWFAGATQVKYSRQDPHVLASAHDRWLHIWDDRKTVEPLKTICAHTSKIYGIDWNRTDAPCLVTCSLDKTIKFWNYEKTDEPERVIRTDFPVWRARHTPFGNGLLAMPQNEPGNLYLYDRGTAPEAPSASEPVAMFSGHGNHKVKEFLWRTRGSITSEGVDEREFQLVSWGEDNELRLQKVEPDILESVGYVKGKTVVKNLALTRKGAAYKTFRAVDDTVHRDRRTATMSDPRPGSSGQYRKSALSYGLNSHLRRVGPTWRGSPMKAKVNGGKSMDKSQLQIGWMKGISMTKRKSESDGPGRGSIKDSGLFSHGAYDDDWAEPESIQDEFIHVSNRLPNVKWENIDMDALILNASLKGPWGFNDEGIFIKVKVDIPTSYPTSKAPKFYVEKTSFMPEETHEKIERELQILANQFLERKQNCLEVAFSYLLGDVDLENSTTLFKNVRDLNDEEIEALADESSSDEEDSDVQARGSVSMSQDLTASTELDPTATLAPTQRPIAVPTPRKCGARFSNDGRLVCFFPSKEQQALALFSISNSDAYRDRQKGEPNFAGFGRLTQDSPPPRRRYNDDDSGSDDMSDGSEDSESSSSSDSEPSTMHKISLWHQPGGRSLKKTWSTNDSLRSSGGGTGAGTGTGTGISRRRLPARPKNIIALHDLRSLLPSQKQFAQEYAIFGDGAEVCMHNAMVAEKYGYHDLVHIWHYAAMLLRNDIPLEIHEQQNRKESVLVIARDASARVRDDEYAQHFGWDSNLSGRVKWGYHPLAQSLIADLFNYFEKVADIQMLAMLACIFGDSSAEDGVAYAGSHLPQPETPLPMKAPSFSLEYFPTDPALWHINYKSQASSAITTPRTVHTPAIYSESPGIEDVVALLEPTPNSFSAGETPPKMSRDHLREGDQTQSLSTSPSNRLFTRSNTAVSAAFSLPKTLAGMVSGSPPDPPPRKRPSPAEAIFNNLAPSVTWGTSTVFGGTAPETPGTARTSLSDDESRNHDMTVLVPVAVSVVPENQGLFDDDGWLNTPLLDPSRNHVYSYYRYAYAEMLQMWGQPLSRLEIMKFNVLKGDKTSSSGCYSDVTHSIDGYYDHETAENTAANSASQNPAFGGRKEQLQALIASGRGLDVTGICRIHEEQLDPVEYTRPTKGKYGGAVGTCHRCVKAGNKKEQKQLRCVYCLEPIAALYPPCLNCGCAFHEACLAEWHEMGEEECPAGDDCCCVEDASTAHVERWSALQAAVAAMNKMRSAASGSLHQQVDRDKEKSSGNQSGISRRSSIKTVLTGVASVATGGTGSRPRRRSVPTDLAKFMRGGRSDPNAYRPNDDNDDDYDEDDDDLPTIAITSSNGGSSDRSRSAHPTNRRAVPTASPSGITTNTIPHQFGRRRGGSSASHLAATGGYSSGYGHRSSNLSHFYIAADDNSGDSADSNNEGTATTQFTASNSNRASQTLLSGNDIDREEWESVASSRGIPSLSNDPLHPSHPSHHSRSGSRSGNSSRSASGGSDTGGGKDTTTTSSSSTTTTPRVGDSGSDNSKRPPHHERTPSGRGFTALKPPPYGDEPISAARLSLGNRLKKHIAGAASAAAASSGSSASGSGGSGGNGNAGSDTSGGGETGVAGGSGGGGGNGSNGNGSGGSSSSLLGGGAQRPSLLRKKSTGVAVWRGGN